MVKSNQLVVANCSLEKTTAQIELQNVTKNWIGHLAKGRGIFPYLS